MSDRCFAVTDARSSWTDRIADCVIGGYQCYLSPYKGFSCAYRVLNEERGEASCSSFARLLIAEKGLGASFPEIRERFKQCGMAHRTLREQKARLINAEDLRRANIVKSSTDAPTDPPTDDENTEGAPKQKGGIARSSNRRNAVSTGGVSNRGGCDALDCGFLSCEAIDCGACACDSLDLSGCACSSLSGILAGLLFFGLL